MVNPGGLAAVGRAFVDSPLDEADVSKPGSLSRGGIAAGSAEFILDESGLILAIGASGDNARLASGISEGVGIAEYVHPDDRHAFALLARSVLQPDAPAVTPALRIRWARSNGHYSRVYATISSESAETVRVSLVRDDAEQMRRRAAQLLKVVEGSLQGIIVRTNNEILFMNDGFAHLLGYPSARELMADDEASGLNARIHPEDVPIIVERVRRRMAGEEIISHYELRVLHRDGKYRWMDTLAAAVRWDDQMASLSWLSDITARKELEAEIIRSRDAAQAANRAKSEFLAHMSHELRTPLNAIIGFAEVIRDQLVGPAQRANYADYADDIHKSGHHLLGLINDLLDLAKLEAGKFELREADLSLSNIVEQACILMRDRARAAGVRLLHDTPNTLPLLYADERALKQVVLNFLSNAIKFTSKGGVILAAVARRADGGMMCSVVDNGIGMSADDIALALTPYGQVDSRVARRHAGTGLGLPISKSLIELHGGELLIESEPCFTAWSFHKVQIQQEWLATSQGRSAICVFS